MLWEDFLETCILQTKTSVSDGQGGRVVSLTDGNSFKAAIIKNRSIQERVAEKQGVQATYTVTTPTEQLTYGTIFKRMSDNKLFIVNSDYKDTKPPTNASFTFYQVQSEEYNI